MKARSLSLQNLNVDNPISRGVPPLHSPARMAVPPLSLAPTPRALSSEKGSPLKTSPRPGAPDIGTHFNADSSSSRGVPALPLRSPARLAVYAFPATPRAHSPDKAAIPATPRGYSSDKAAALLKVPSARSSADAVMVACRVRPLEISRAIGIDEEDDVVGCVRIDPSGTSLTVLEGPENGPSPLPHPFTFDRVFPPSASQEHVFEAIGAPVLQSILAGFNGCVLAYGQVRGRRERGGGR
jgi:hypothetical protein